MKNETVTAAVMPVMVKETNQVTAGATSTSVDTTVAVATTAKTGATTETGAAAKTQGHFTRKIGNTTFIVSVAFSDKASESIEDKVLRLVRTHGRAGSEATDRTANDTQYVSVGGPTVADGICSANELKEVMSKCS